MLHGSRVSTAFFVRVSLGLLACSVSCKTTDHQTSSDGGSSHTGSHAGNDAGNPPADAGQHVLNPWHPSDAGHGPAVDSGSLSDGRSPDRLPPSRSMTAVPRCARQAGQHMLLVPRAATACSRAGRASFRRALARRCSVPGCSPACGPGSVCIRHQELGGAKIDPSDAGGLSESTGDRSGGAAHLLDAIHVHVHADPGCVQRHTPLRLCGLHLQRRLRRERPRSAGLLPARAVSRDLATDATVVVGSVVRA